MSENALMTIARDAVIVFASLGYYIYKERVVAWFSKIVSKDKKSMTDNDKALDTDLIDHEQETFSHELDSYMEKLLEKGALSPEPSISALAIREQLAEEAIKHFEKVQNELTSKHCFGDRWNYDQEIAELTFYENDKLIFKVKAQILGSYSHNSNTWLWSFFNESILPNAQDELFSVWKTILTIEEIFPIAYEVKGDDYLSKMLAIAVFMSQAQGAYIAKNEKNNSDTYFIITDILNK